MTALVILAKEPVPGRVKTRLCPPCTPEQAAHIARAALSDTLAAVGSVRDRRRVLVLDGDVGSWLPSGFEVISQRGAGLAERLAAAFDDVGGPTLLVGMDTPQVSPSSLDEAARMLERPGVDAVLGPAVDGGYWAIGLRQADPSIFRGVPMSRPDTGAAQHRRLKDRRLTTVVLEEMHDVDTFETATKVAELVPSSRFAAAVRDARSGSDNPSPAR